MSEQVTAEIVAQVLRDRKTTKVLADEPYPVDVDLDSVVEIVAAAGWAPFHRPSDTVHHDHAGLSSIVPWRFHILDASSCRNLRRILLTRKDKSKVPRMLAAASALIQATWLPNPARKDSEQRFEFEPTLANMEHIASAAAAVQSLLIGATSRGILSYWSSGGILRTQEAFGWLAIPDREILLGSVFLFPKKTKDAEKVKGKLRQMRGPVESWARWVEIG